MTQPFVTAPEERELAASMIAYQGGDLAAFQRLHGILSEELHRYFARSPRERRAVHDLVQDTFLEIHRSRRTYLPPLPVRPWVFGIARNVLARSRRVSPGERLATSLDAHAGSVLAAPASTAHPGDELDVERALAGLPANAREPWLLHHAFGFTFQSIAERLGITVMAAKLRSSRATHALRSALRGHSGDSHE